MNDTTGATDLCRMTPEQLLARVARGDRAALDALYDGTAARLYAVCLALLEDRIEAEEALEETFLAVWRDAGTQPGSGLEAMAWLGAVACDRAGLRIAMRDAADAADAARPDGAAQLRQAPGCISRDRGLAGAVAGRGPGGAAGPAAAGGAGRVVDGAAFAAHAALVRELVPVMPPARARRRIRERLGHVAAPLSEVIDSRIRWWQRPWGVLTAAVALALLVLVGVALLRPGRPDDATAGTANAGTRMAPVMPAPTARPPGAAAAAGLGASEAAALLAPDAGRGPVPR